MNHQNQGFAALLEQSRISEALQGRINELERQAYSTRLELEAAKAVSGGSLLLGILLSSNPLIGALAGFGAALYGCALWRDYSTSGKLCPLPGSRKSIMQIIYGAGKVAQQDGSAPQQDADPIETVLSYLEPQQAIEYELLACRFAELTRFLQQLQPHERRAGYDFALLQARLNPDTLAIPSTTEAREAIAIPAPSPTAALPAAAEPQDAAASFSPTGETVEGEPIAPSTELQSGPASSAAAPDLASITNPKQRMAALLNAMAEVGCPLGSLLNHPFVWCWGRSQSGKTSIALLLAMARMAMGHKVGYLTTDDDYPRELPWSRVEDSPEGYAVALDEVAETISSATKGGLAGQGWIFDELFAASATHNIKIQPLLTTVLMKGAKTKAGVIGISQADTSSAHGLKGIDAAWREERVSVQAIHAEDSQGDRRPTGRYIIRQGDEQQEWQLPPWMLSERNQRGDIDPVAWMLKQFPELVSRPTAAPAPAPTPTPSPAPAPQPQDDRARLEQLFRAETAPEKFPPASGNFQDGGKISRGTGNPETQREREFPAADGSAESFQENDFYLGKPLYLAVAAALRAGKGKSAIVQDVLECSGRKYKYGCAWYDALIQKFGEPTP